MLADGSGYVNPSEVAGLIFEPIQGEGGYRFPSDAFTSEIAACAAEFDIPLIVDEVQSGVGRTGEWWASDHYPFEPDVIASAKGLRVGATISRSDVFPDEKSRLSSTWGAGDILSSAQGVLTLDAIEEYNLRENAVARGELFKDLLAEHDPDGVVDVRGKGLLLGVEFASQDLRDAVEAAAFERGLLVIGCGTKTIRLLPPLDVTEREIHLGVELFTEACAETAA